VKFEQVVEAALPLAAVGAMFLAAVAVGLAVVQRSLVAAKLAPAGFPLSRKLLPACFALVLAFGARGVVSALRYTGALTHVFLELAAVWTIAYLVLRILWVSKQLLFHRFDIEGDDNLRSRRVRTQLQFIEKLSYAGIVFLAVCASLLLFDAARNFGQSLLASAGIAGLAVGFAAQKSLANLVAGFQIAFTQPIRIEDVVVVEGEWGWVEEINLTYVVLRLWDRRRLVLPITYFVEKPFQNWTRTTSQIIGSVFIEVSHRVPFQALESELFRLLDATPMWDGDVRVLQVVEAQAQSVSLRALMTARNSPTCWDLRCYVRRGLVEFLQQQFPASLPVVRIDPQMELPARPDAVSGTVKRASDSFEVSGDGTAFAKQG